MRADLLHDARLALAERDMSPVLVLDELDGDLAPAFAVATPRRLCASAGGGTGRVC